MQVHMHLHMHNLALTQSRGKRKTMKEQQTDPLTVFGSLEASADVRLQDAVSVPVPAKSLRSDNKMLVMDAIVHSADGSSPLGVFFVER